MLGNVLTLIAYCDRNPSLGYGGLRDDRLAKNLPPGCTCRDQLEDSPVPCRNCRQWAKENRNE